MLNACFLLCHWASHVTASARRSAARSSTEALNLSWLRPEPVWPLIQPISQYHPLKCWLVSLFMRECVTGSPVILFFYRNTHCLVFCDDPDAGHKPKPVGQLTKLFPGALSVTGVFTPPHQLEVAIHGCFAPYPSTSPSGGQWHTGDVSVAPPAAAFPVVLPANWHPSTRAKAKSLLSQPPLLMPSWLSAGLGRSLMK